MKGIEIIRKMVDDNKKNEIKKGFSELFKGMFFYSWDRWQVNKYVVLGTAPNVRTTHTVLISNCETGVVRNASWKSIVFADTPACLFLNKKDLYTVCKAEHEKGVKKFSKLIDDLEKTCETCRFFHNDTDIICHLENTKECGHKNNYKYWAK